MSRKPEEFTVGDRWLDTDGDEHLILLVDPENEKGTIVSQYGTEKKLGRWRLDDSLFVRKIGPKLVRYANVYADADDGCGSVWTTVADCDERALSSRIGRIRIEFEEGQFDD